MSVEKRCGCDEARWPKCAHPWYMAKFRWQGKSYEPNLTRHAEVLKQLTLPTKTEADAYADTVRTEIRNGTYVAAKTQQNLPAKKSDDEQPRVLTTPAVADFLDNVIDTDTEMGDQTKGRHRNHLERFAAFRTKSRGVFGEQPVDVLDGDDVIAFRRSDELRRLANSSWAKFRTSLVMFFSWAKSKGKTNGYIDVSPFDVLAPHQKKALKRGKFHKRNRRVYRDEQALLIKAAGRAREEAVAIRLQSMIVAAIEAAMRKGELLALQWGDVDIENRDVTVRAEEVGARKTGKSRHVPISDALAVELIALRTDPTGNRWPNSAYVFGDETGARITTIAKAWESCVLRAHGVEPVWVKNNKLSPACRAKLRDVKLHFHDLRHEAATRWYLEDGWGLGEIRDALGHTSIAQTETYLNIDGATAPAEAMRRGDARKRAASAAAAAQSAGGSSGDKLSANGRRGNRGGNGPRLVHSANSRREV